MLNALGGNVIYKFLGDTSNLDKATKGVKSTLGTVGKVAGTLGGVVIGVTTTVASALVTITKQSVEAYGELEQLTGGAQKIFDEMDFNKIEQDAKKAYKTMNLSASQYLAIINDVGATFASTMGDEKGYITAQKGLQAIADYASGTGKNVDLLGQKFTMITRATSTYQSIADQFSGILPATSQDFLEQAQACGLLSQEYEKLTDVPIAEYQQAVSEMLVRGVTNMGLANNTLMESTETLTGSIASAKSAIQNFLSGAGGFEEVIETVTTAGIQVGKAVNKMLPQIVNGIVGIVNGLIPELPGLIQTLLPALLDGTVTLIQGLVSALPSLLTTLAGLLPSVVQSLVDVFVQVANAFSEQAPVIMPIVVEALVDALITLLDNVDVILGATIALMIGLTKGIIQCLPILVEKAPDIIEALILGLIDCVPMLIESGWDLNKAIIKGIIKAIPSMWKAGLQVTQKLYDAIIKGVPEMIKSGKNLIKGLWEGIKNFDLIGNMKKLIGSAIDAVKGVLKIGSPSKVFGYLGKMSMLGYTNELEDMKGMLDDTIQSTFSISPTLTSGSLHYSPNVIVNNNITSNTDSLGQTVTNIKTFANGAKNDYNYGMGV